MTCNLIFENNLIALQSKNSKLAEKIQNTEKDPCLSVMTRGNDYELLYQKEKSKIALTNAGMTRQTIARAIAAQLDEQLDELQTTNLVVLISLDLKSTVMELLAQCPWYLFVLTIMPSLPYLRALMEMQDISTILADPRVLIYADITIEVLTINLKADIARSDITTLGYSFFSFYPISEIYPSFSKDVSTSVITIFKQLSLSMNTSMAFPDLTRNEILAVDKIYKYPVIGQLKDRWKDKPIVCVAAGPSLNKNIDFLKEIQNEVFIITVASCLNTLLVAGIRPDLITILDMQAAVEKQLIGMEIDTIPVLVEMSCYEGILEKYPTSVISPSAVAGKSLIKRLFEDLGVDVGPTVRPRFTVAFFSIEVAMLLGASRVILLGQDLAYENLDYTHAAGVVLDGKVKISELNGEEILEIDDTLLGKQYAGFKWVKGINIEKVATMESFFVMKLHLEEWIKAFHLPVTNCTEGGAYIENAEHLTLKEAYEKYIKMSPISTKNLGLLTVEVPHNLSEKIKNIEKTIKGFKDIIRYANKGLENIEQYRAEKKDYKDFVKDHNHYAAKIDTYAFHKNCTAENHSKLWHQFTMAQKQNRNHLTPAEKNEADNNLRVLFFCVYGENSKMLLTELTIMLKRLKKYLIKD